MNEKELCHPDETKKNWIKPEVNELDFSETRFGGQGAEDGDGFGEPQPPPPIS